MYCLYDRKQFYKNIAMCISKSMMSARYRNKVCCREVEMSQPIRGRDSHSFFFLFARKTKTLVVDNNFLLPVKFPQIPFIVSEKSKM